MHPDHHRATHYLSGDPTVHAARLALAKAHAAGPWTPDRQAERYVLAINLALAVYNASDEARVVDLRSNTVLLPWPCNDTRPSPSRRGEQACTRRPRRGVRARLTTVGSWFEVIRDTDVLVRTGTDPHDRRR